MTHHSNITSQRSSDSSTAQFHARDPHAFEATRTLVDVLHQHAQTRANDTVFTFLVDGENREEHLTFGELWQKALAIAAKLRELGASGERALLLYPPGLDYAPALFGCFLAGVVAVPEGPPDIRKPERNLARLQAVAADARASFVLVPSLLLPLQSKSPAGLSEVNWIATDTISSAIESAEWPFPEPRALAYLQYTSGSTADPKGVMLTHAHLLTNCQQINGTYCLGPEGITVSWVPAFHDLGLLYSIGVPIYTGSRCVSFAAAQFVQRPIRWLWAISRYRATHSIAPNTAFDLATLKTKPEERVELDLRSWRMAFNAAEPIYRESEERFVAIYSHYGFERDSICHGFGLAEATCQLSAELPGHRMTYVHVDSNALTQNRFVLVPPETADARAVADCGTPAADTTFIVVDPETRMHVGEGQVGELWVRGPSVGLGYWNKPQATEETFGARLADDDQHQWLRTGDLVSMQGRRVFIVGRQKDIIIVRGQNHHPQDLEGSLRGVHPALRIGGAVVFSVLHPHGERVAVVAEVQPDRMSDPESVFAAVRAAFSGHGLRPSTILLVPPGTIPKTTSGKLQRRKTRQMMLDGEITTLALWIDEASRADAEHAFDLPVEFAGLPTDELRRRLVQLILGAVTALLGDRAASRIAADRPLQEVGLDSVMFAELGHRLSKRLGFELPTTVFFDKPSPNELAQWLAGERLDAECEVTQGVHHDEDIAIVGMACRFPGGVTTPEALWDLLKDGVDAIDEVPATRWDIDSYYSADPNAVGKMATRWGGFLHDIENFDAAFFSISPREARSLDPQQRLLLETVWEALERAGIPADGLMGSDTGVYVGICGNEYQQRTMANVDELDAYSLLGTAYSAIVGRISYSLGLQGPNMAVDTACSSSLVSVHLACKALQAGECSMALAGGVNLVLSPASTVYFSRLKAMSPTGRCHTFSADADGYVRSEGCGIVVLKRLSDALRDGDAILAVIRGTAVNQDGRSQGLTAPNGPAQSAVIRKALAVARVEPADVDYVETHGTGTPLGDPIEVQALAAVLGKGRKLDEPVILGSVKTNIGHTEGAAGIAGLMKVVLSLQHGKIPRSLHFTKPNFHINWPALPVKVASEAIAWRNNGKLRIAGVSAFGFSGTNAHVILEEAHPQKKANIQEASFYLLPLSAKTPEALSALARSYQESLSKNAELLHDIAFTASVKRSHLEYRLGVVGATKGEIAAALGAFALGEMPPGLVTSKVSTTHPQVVFVFSGQGSQWVGMGRQLYRDEPSFRDAMSACDAAIRKEAGFSIIEEMDKPAETSRLSETIVAQPALFAMAVALSRLLQSWGVVPSAVVGHSVGEIAAAHIAGLLDLEQAARLVSIRGRIMQKATGHGKMVSVALGEDTAKKAITGLEDRIGIAAVNDPTSVVLSGDIDAIDEIVARLSADGVQTRNLRVNYAFHSPQMAPFVAEFVEALGDVPVKSGHIAMISTVTGKPLRAGEMDAAYWGRNLRQTVRFAEAIRSAIGNGHQLLVEVGPHPVLAVSTEETLAAQHTEARVIPTLRREKDERQHALGALGALYTHGVAIDWKQVYPQGGRVVELPTYPWQRQRYWIEAQKSSKQDPRSLGLEKVDHPFLRAAISSPEDGALLLTGRLALIDHPWLGDHVVAGRVVFPGTGFVELALAAADRVRFAGIEELTIETPLLLSSGYGVVLRVTVEPAADARGRRFAIHARLETDTDDSPWMRHAQGVLGLVEEQEFDLMLWPPPGATSVELDGFYSQLVDRGLEYGPAFQGLTAAWRDADSIYAEVRLPESFSESDGAFRMHPALLDAALQALSLTDDIGDGLILPFAFEGVSLRTTQASGLRLRITHREGTAALLLADANGTPVAHINALRTRKVDPSSWEKLHTPHRDQAALYHIEWMPISLDAVEQLNGWVVLGDVPSGKTMRVFSDVGALQSALDTGEAVPVGVLVALRASDNIDVDAAHAATANALALLKTWLLDSRLDNTKLVFLTKHAISIGPGDAVENLNHAPIWGLVRVALAEHPDRGLGIIDHDDTQASWNALASVLLLSDAQIVLRRGVAFGPRLNTKRHEQPLEMPSRTDLWRLHFREQGQVDALALVPDSAADAPLQPREIRIAMRAAGLNFRDVLNALGMYPGVASPPGFEGAGIVIDVCPGVEDYAPGDRVMGLLTAAFGTQTIADERMVTRIPRGLDFAKAAGIPLAFLTAWYGLVDLGHLRPGERVLVHAAAGGVGMAAVQVAKHLGAEVFGTAHPDKWDALRAMGLDDDHIASSRDSHFESKFRDVTGGVDVVLNSLVDDFADASLRLLRKGGRFVEMGKRDIRDAHLIESTTGVHYRAFDLSEAGPNRIQEMLAELNTLFTEEKLRPLPTLAWDIRWAPLAFRFMAQAQHRGKLVLTVPKALDPNGTVLLTGGLGGLSKHVARHLVLHHGVRHLLLVSRRGMADPAANVVIAELAELGAHTVVAACDVSDRSALATLLANIPSANPLTGIVHTAGVLEDALIANLDEDKLVRVLRPKLDAAIHLDALTAEMDLSAFVMFSSAAGIFGNAGQAAYAAANVFLDALATRRRASGKHALSLAWGPWDGSGMASTLSDTDRLRIRRTGIVPMNVADGLALFDTALRMPDAMLAPLALDHQALRTGGEAIAPLLRQLAPIRRQVAMRSGEQTSKMVLARIPEAQRAAHTLAVIRQNAAEVLGLGGSDAIPTDKSLFELGLDSLMAVELRNRLAKTLGIRIDASAVLQAPKPNELVAVLLRAIAVAPDELPATTMATVMATSQRSTQHPLSAAQSRLYFLDRVLERRETYNIQIALRIDAVLSVERLQTAIALLISRHDQLRMHIVDGPDGPQQRILPWVDVPVEVVDLRQRGENALVDLIRERAVVPFDLTKAPLWRVSLALLSEKSSGLILVWHHLATDGWSVGRFLHELDMVYSTPDVQLPTAPTYPEIVATYRLNAPETEEHRRFWTKYLEGVQALDLPTDHAPVRRERRGATVPFTFDIALSDRIDAVARTIGVTPFVVLLTGWALVMQRYCRQEDITIGVISSGRMGQEAKDAIGLFVETLPVRCVMDGARSVTASIAAQRQSLLDALAHERLPLDEILGVVSNVHRGDISETPLLRVSFVLEQASWMLESFAGAKAVLIGDSVSGDVEGTNKFDLGLAMVRTVAGYRASIEYAADLFEPDTIHRLAGHLRQALTSMVASPENRLSDVEMLTAAERYQLLVEWNDTAQPYRDNVGIHELFEEQVERTPLATAVVFEDQQLTYTELDARSNQLAHYLQRMGVGPEILVAICVERSIEMVVGLLGILKAGGAYVPLDPAYPKERIAFMLEDAASSVFLTQERLRATLPDLQATIVCLDSEWETIARESTDSPSSTTCSDNSAYVIYTSGSTGQPKGVVMVHKGLVNLSSWHMRVYDLGPTERTAQVASLGFDAATWEIWPSLISGASLWIPNKETRASPMSLVSWLIAEAITITFLPTPVAEAALLEPWSNRSALRLMLTGGDRLRTRPTTNTHFRLINHYGPTECTVVTTSCEVTHDGVGTPPIGRPIANTRVYVLDAYMQPVPIGCAGDLYIGGAGVARGYLKRAELTAERFVQDPFSKEPNARLYETGDLCRWLPDGNLEFLGRIDLQVKIRGFRIELGEIEAVLSSHSSVRACIVVAREDRPGDKRLVAYVVLNENECSVSMLRAYLAAKLPDYMIPAAFDFLDAMPLTPNGKIDRKALPAPEFDRVARSIRFAPPRTRTEAMLTSLWTDVLGLDSIGIRDNFFELGGNSLSSIRLIGRAAKVGLSLTVRQLFEFPTIAGLAKALAMNAASTARCIVSLRPNGSEIPFVLTPGLAGTSMVFLPLRDALRETIPVWSFDDPHLAGHSPQLDTIDALAREWVAELLATVPDAPAYRLGGYSFGGMVVIEMARQLIALGKSIECVLILDGGIPNKEATFEPLDFIEALAKNIGAPDTVRSGVIETDIEEVLRRIADTLGTRQESVVDDPLAWARTTIVAAEKNHQRMNQWQVRPVDVPITLLRTSSKASRNADLGWSQALGRPVQVLFVPGEHDTMLERPLVQTLAFCIEGLLAQHDGQTKRR